MSELEFTGAFDADVPLVLVRQNLRRLGWRRVFINRPYMRISIRMWLEENVGELDKDWLTLEPGELWLRDRVSAMRFKLR